MAAYDGEFCSNVEKTHLDGKAGYTRLATGVVYTWGGGGAPPAVTHYHKRSWRAETPGYVYWDTTTPSGAYPGGGTLDPPLGTILNQWVT